MKNKIRTLLRENLNKISKFEYQIRDIDGPVYYKRKKGSEVWSFTDCEDYSKNANDENIVKWEEKK